MAREFAKLLAEDLNLGVGPATKPNPGGGTLTGSKIGLHTFAVGGQKLTVTWDPPAVPSSQVVTNTVAYPGVALGDFARVSFSLSLQGMLLDASVDAPNQVKVTLFNPTITPIDLGSGTLTVLVFRI
jgi:hypothetical protein